MPVHACHINQVAVLWPVDAASREMRTKLVHTANLIDIAGLDL